MEYFMYMGGASKLVLTVFYLPICLLILFLINRFLRKRLLQSNYRIAIISILAISMFFFATWDAILGKYYLDKYCEADGGTYINTDERVTGRYLAYRPREETAINLLSKGYSYIEMGKDGDYVRYTLGDSGELMALKVTKLNSNIEKDDEYRDVGPDYLHMVMLNGFLINTSTKEVLGGFRNYHISTNLDYKLGGIGAIGGNSCTDIDKFKDRERFNTDHNYDYEYILVNLNKDRESEK